ncbi:MAG: hypothetical protein U9Q34_04625, partial [Elusimicrobiota bacterium]|nr:hypothetical protein [Elusimicrobiota bacterium]
GGENRLDWIMRRHWERLAMAADVGEKAIIGICKKMGETALKETEILVKTFEKNNEANKTILKIRKHILKRSDILRVI